MALLLYDTASRKKAPFTPLRPGRAGVYSCGPTVYRYAHIGNLRTYLLTDLLVRTLRFSGFSTFSVQNVTDMGHMHQEDLEQVEDKVISAARAAGRTGREIAAHFTEAFFADCRRMNFLPADVYPRASEHVPEMIGLVREAERKGAVYSREGYLYFDVTRAAGYGGFSGARFGEGQAAARTDASIHRHKKRAEDFTLWLPAGPDREFRWESPWGTGWPGWHVECAAMALKYLGAEFDLHVGGIDLRFPHHENSRAMAMTATGGRFASVWMHAAHLLVEGRKMSKSLRNEWTLSDLEARGVSPMDFRYYCLTLHYRTPMNFTWEGQAAAARALSRLKGTIARAEPSGKADPSAAEEARRRFREAVEDDLNLPRAVAVVREAAYSGVLGAALPELAAEWDSVLGLGLLSGEAREERVAGGSGEKEEPPPPAEVSGLVASRESARREGRYREADALRARIREAGFEVVDTKCGPPFLKRIRGGSPP